MSDDPKLSERYRELPREEPPRALDEAILAASRRAVQRRRWYGPVAIAAVITLAVAVTLHIQHDRPSEEVDAVAPAMKVQEAPPAPKPAAAQRPERRAPQPFAASPRQDSTVASEPAEEVRKKIAEREVAAARAGVRTRDEPAPARTEMARAPVESTPEMELARIARLRSAGEHDKADKALAEFRRRYPDYSISAEMRARVERPQ